MAGGDPNSWEMDGSLGHFFTQLFGFSAGIKQGLDSAGAARDYERSLPGYFTT